MIHLFFTVESLDRITNGSLLIRQNYRLDYYMNTNKLHSSFFFEIIHTLNL